MIDVKNLTKYYGRTLAVDDITFHVRKGRVVGFLGPNGAGKSTTLKIITCFLSASSGAVTVAGHDVFSESMAVRRKIGYMPENVPLYGDMRVREYLRFRASLRGLDRKQRGPAVDRVCETCWLSKPEDLTGRPIDQLSRGYRQRVGLAEVLLHNPPVLVLDEPTLGLDPAQIRQMRNLIKSLGEQYTVILSSHILAEVEQTCAEAIVIAGGRIVAAGTLDDLRRRVVGPSRLVIELKGAETSQLSSAVKRVAGVKDASASSVGNWVRLAVQAEPNSDPRGELYQLACRNHWQLRELRRQVSSLEDFFIQITYEQQLTRDAQAAGPSASDGAA